MWMADYEVVQSFLRASNHKEQIKVLAELNGCDTLEIISILRNSPKVSSSLLNKALEKRGLKKTETKNVDAPSSTSGSDVECLKEELRRMYSLNIELEEENRRLQHEVILNMVSILKVLANRG